jgi:hypothetical protein
MPGPGRHFYVSLKYQVEQQNQKYSLWKS